MDLSKELNDIDELLDHLDPLDQAIVLVSMLKVIYKRGDYPGTEEEYSDMIVDMLSKVIIREETLN